MKAGPTWRPPPAQYFVLPTAAQRGYHRYRGLLGGRPVQLDLTVTLEHALASEVGSAELRASFSYLDSSQTLYLTPSNFPASQPLELSWTNRLGSSGQELLCTDQPIGPLLTGTYTLDRGPVAFRVREDYSDCLRYEIVHEETVGPPVCHGEDTVRASVSREYLHLLGADTLRSARARMQCPRPARRAQIRAARVQRLGFRTYETQYIDIQLNEANLLAYTLEEREEYTRSRYYESRFRQVLYDLRTGRELRLLEQLRPGGRRQLLHLLRHQAMADTARARTRDFWRRDGVLPLPDRGFAVTPAGLEAIYVEPESEPDLHGYRQTITWATLRPLLRPHSPLYRLLRGQGR
jgi:hypothetical protein